MNCLWDLTSRLSDLERVTVSDRPYRAGALYMHIFIWLDKPPWEVWYVPGKGYM